MSKLEYARLSYSAAGPTLEKHIRGGLHLRKDFLIDRGHHSDLVK